MAHMPMEHYYSSTHFIRIARSHMVRAKEILSERGFRVHGSLDRGIAWEDHGVWRTFAVGSYEVCGLSFARLSTDLYTVRLRGKDWASPLGKRAEPQSDYGSKFTVCVEEVEAILPWVLTFDVRANPWAKEFNDGAARCFPPEFDAVAVNDGNDGEDYPTWEYAWSRKADVAAKAAQAVRDEYRLKATACL